MCLRRAERSGGPGASRPLIWRAKRAIPAKRVTSRRRLPLRLELGGEQVGRGVLDGERSGFVADFLGYL